MEHCARRFVGSHITKRFFGVPAAAATAYKHLVAGRSVTVQLYAPGKPLPTGTCISIYAIAFGENSKNMFKEAWRVTPTNLPTLLRALSRFNVFPCSACGAPYKFSCFLKRFENFDLFRPLVHHPKVQRSSTPFVFKRRRR